MRLFRKMKNPKKIECEMTNLLNVDGQNFNDYFVVKQSQLITQLEENLDELNKYYKKCDKKTKYDRIVIAIIENGNLKILPTNDEILQVRTIYLNKRNNLADITESAKQILGNYYFSSQFWKYLTDVIPIRFNQKLFKNYDMYKDFDNTIVFVFCKVNFEITVSKEHQEIPVWPTIENNNLDDYKFDDYSLLVNVILFSLRSAYDNYYDYKNTLIKIKN